MIWRTSELRPAPPLITIRSLSTPCARDDAPLEKFQDFHTAGMCSRGSFIVDRVGFYEMVDRRAGCRLAAFVEPESRNHPRIIGAPNAGDEARFGRCRHDAGRGPHDIGKTTAYID